MLTTFFVALLHIALLVDADGRTTWQNGSDTALLRKRSNLTDVEFDKRMLARLFGFKKRPSPPRPPLVSVKLERSGNLLIMPLDIGTSMQHLKVKLVTDSSCFWAHSLAKSKTRKKREQLWSLSVITLYTSRIVFKEIFIWTRYVWEGWKRRRWCCHVLGVTLSMMECWDYRSDTNTSFPMRWDLFSMYWARCFLSPVFALYLVGDGELHMGGPHPDYYEENTIENHKVIKPGEFRRWQIGPAVIGLNGYEMHQVSKFTTVFDITTYYIIAPEEEVRKIYKEIWGLQDEWRLPRGIERDGLFPCHEHVELYFRWDGGQEWTISNDIFNVREIHGTNMCQGLIIGRDIGAWTIGTGFLQTLYPVFNATMPHPQISLARLKPAYEHPANRVLPPVYQGHNNHIPPDYQLHPPAHHVPPLHEPQPPHYKGP